MHLVLRWIYFFIFLIKNCFFNVFLFSFIFLITFHLVYIFILWADMDFLKLFFISFFYELARKFLITFYFWYITLQVTSHYVTTSPPYWVVEHLATLSATKICVGFIIKTRDLKLRIEHMNFGLFSFNSLLIQC